MTITQTARDYQAIIVSKGYGHASLSDIQTYLNDYAAISAACEKNPDCDVQTMWNNSASHKTRLYNKHGVTYCYLVGIHAGCYQ